MTRTDLTDFLFLLRNVCRKATGQSCVPSTANAPPRFSEKRRQWITFLHTLGDKKYLSYFPRKALSKGGRYPGYFVETLRFNILSCLLNFNHINSTNRFDNEERDGLYH